MSSSRSPAPEDDAEVERFVAEIQALTYAPVREKVEQLVERLDQWKLRGPPQKLIARVDTPLLQLLHVVEKQEGEQNKSTYNEECSEIAYFDADFILRINEDGWGRLLAESPPTRVSNVVAVIGDTHSGKSTLISSLIAAAKAKPDTADSQQDEPTTANVHCYDFDVEIPGTDRCLPLRFLDCEGENGGKPPKWAQRERLEALLRRMNIDMAEYQRRRREAVGVHVTRLAYVTADIVIFVWNESFSNAGYSKRLIDLAHSSVDRVDSATSPALIIIYNKCGLDEIFDVGECTAKFFENPENREIRMLYSDVRCVCVPHKDQVKKAKRPGSNTPYFIDGEKVFQLQIERIATHLQETLDKRLPLKKELGLLFSDHVWCLLFKEVVTNFDCKLRMAELLAHILKPQDCLASRAIEFFLSMYALEGKKDKEAFLRVRRSALAMLSCVVVSTFHEKQQVYDKFVALNGLKYDSVKRELDKGFFEMHDMLDRLAPCEVPFPEPLQDNRVVFCSQEKACHGPVHRSSENVLVKPSATSLLTRLSESLKYWLKIGYRPTWQGDHSFYYPLTASEERLQFLQRVEDLTQVTPSQLFIIQAALLQTLACKSKVKSNMTDHCWICLKNLPTHRLMPCKHVFCSHCLDVLDSVREGSAPVSLGDAYEDLDEAVIDRAHCPLCREQVMARENLPADQLQQLKLRPAKTPAFTHLEMLVSPAGGPLSGSPSSSSESIPSSSPPQPPTSPDKQQTPRGAAGTSAPLFQHSVLDKFATVVPDYTSPECTPLPPPSPQTTAINQHHQQRSSSSSNWSGSGGVERIVLGSPEASSVTTSVMSPSLAPSLSSSLTQVPEVVVRSKTPSNNSSISKKPSVETVAPVPVSASLPAFDFDTLTQKFESFKITQHPLVSSPPQPQQLSNTNNPFANTNPFA